MYNEYKKLDLPAIDQEVLAFWAAEKIFERSVTEREGAETFVFYEGPPSANGMPGIHHVLSRAIKDTFCRFQTLQGKQVHRKGGWDTHGLPIELAVEKELGITKEDIGKKISIAEYNAKCKEMVMRFKDRWDDLTVKMGYWVDLDNPYITFEKEYMESVWHLLGILYDKGLLYKGYTIQPYSPAAGTGLSSHELNQPGCYQDVTDTTVAALFVLKQHQKAAFLFENENEDVRISAWTTTPWTLPSNTALTVGPNIDYVKIKTENVYTKTPVSVVLAKDLVGKWFGGKNQPVILAQSEPFKGHLLEGLEYEQLMPYNNPIEELDGKKDAFKVILGSFVTTSDGTGVVHTAPSFGAEDRQVAKAAGIGALTLVDKQGKFIDTVGVYSGRYVKDYRNEPDYVSVDVDIAVQLKQDGKALNVQKYVHSYPHCWRTDKPILYYPLDSWFIRASSMRERMLELNNTINWKPAATGEGRFGKWLENLQDWNLSRSRYWGIPLPIWRTAPLNPPEGGKADGLTKNALSAADSPPSEGSGEAGQAELLISSIAQLTSEIEKANRVLGLNQTVPQDLHRPYIDDVILVDDNGNRMVRELDLIDVWFDSGSMPYAQHHYPFENTALYEGDRWVADFIAEGVDQTRGWFYTLHAIATMCFDSVAYKNVVSNGLVLDKLGRKMSKRWGNAVDPFATIEQHGADVTRWYMMTNSQPWDNLKFDIDGLTETRNKFFGTLYNTYNFFAIYANVDNFVTSEFDRVAYDELAELDKWIISKLNSLVQDVTRLYAEYEPTQAGRLIEEFVDAHLSNWYVRLARKRFWRGEMTQDKKAAYETLQHCLVQIAQLMSPIAPFFGDWLYRNITEPMRPIAIAKQTPLRHNSVHLTHLAQAETQFINTDLEQRMDYAQRISSLVLSLRKAEKIRVRQPLGRILLPVLDNNFQAQVHAVQDLILQEVNIKTIEFITDTSGVVSKKVKPNFKVLGKKLGKNMAAAKSILENLSQADIAALETNKVYVLKIENETIDVLLEEVEIVSDQIPGWSVANDGAITVALDTHISDDLRAEGTARELVNRIQTLRKTSNFNVTDRINVTLQPHESIANAIAQFGSYIQQETLTDTLTLTETVVNGELIELLDGVSLLLGVAIAN
jgi:isoleucyl-tRNA synthetase